MSSNSGGVSCAGERTGCGLDLLFEKQHVGIETDAYAYHSAVDSFEDDRERNNGLIALGYRVRHWTWRAITDTPEQLIADLFVAMNLPR